MTKITLEVNGKKVSKEVADHTLLSVFLRDNLNLTGTHVGCDTSQCGACVVHVNGKSIKSCSTLAADVEGSKVTTIEGLAKDELLEEISTPLFNLNINEKSEIIETNLAKHVLVLKNIEKDRQLKLNEVENLISDSLKNIETKG